VNGQTDIEGRCACLHVVDEEAAEPLRREVGDGRLNCKPGALPRNSLPRPAGFFIPGITLGCRNPSTGYRRNVSRLLPMLRDARVARSSA
jgi:hypothetical protein